MGFTQVLGLLAIAIVVLSLALTFTPSTTPDIIVPTGDGLLYILAEKNVSTAKRHWPSKQAHLNATNRPWLSTIEKAGMRKSSPP